MQPATALIGHTGFVGTTLKRQARFDELYRSSDIDRIRGREFGLVVCAGAPGVKWRANSEPQADRASIELLMSSLREVRAERLVLISTVDVFGHPVGVDESSEPGGSGVTAYGEHRLALEQFARDAFDAVVVRLPALVGPGLLKNVLFDMLNGNLLDRVDPHSVFQFYPMVSLWPDIETALRRRLELVHLTAEPVSAGSVARDCFGIDVTGGGSGTPAEYDFRTRHAAHFGGAGHYTYSARESLLAIRAYAQSEGKASR